jgi:hypothetical protein
MVQEFRANGFVVRVVLGFMSGVYEGRIGSLETGNQSCQGLKRDLQIFRFLGFRMQLRPGDIKESTWKVQFGLRI